MSKLREFAKKAFFKIGSQFSKKWAELRKNGGGGESLRAPMASQLHWRGLSLSWTCSQNQWMNSKNQNPKQVKQAKIWRVKIEN